MTQEAPEAIQALINRYSTAGANLLDWLDAADLAALPSKRASEQQWRDWGSDVACRATFRALREAKDAVAAKPDTSTDSMTKPVMRPAEPARDAKPVWYRGWECSYNSEASPWCCDGWVAYLGGADLDCIQASARTWAELLDEIDEHDKTEDAQCVLEAELLAALAPFAAVAEHDIGDGEADAELFQVMGKYNRAPKLTVGDFRRALAAIAKANGDPQ